MFTRTFIYAAIALVWKLGDHNACSWIICNVEVEEYPIYRGGIVKKQLVQIQSVNLVVPSSPYN
jgi:hypothetical protein